MNNKRNAGRPASIIELHLNNFDATIEKILGLSEKNRLRLLKLCSEIQYTLSSSSSIGTQTETKTYADISCQTSSLNAEQILEDIGEGNLSDNDLEFLVSNIFPNYKIKFLTYLFRSMTLIIQVKFCSLKNWLRSFLVPYSLK